jgi:hypothetical protein
MSRIIYSFLFIFSKPNKTAHTQKSVTVTIIVLSIFFVVIIQLLHKYTCILIYNMYDWFFWRHDDYDYGEVNQLLERSLKAFIKSACCYPERVTKKDYDRVLREFRHSEKVRNSFQKLILLDVVWATKFRLQFWLLVTGIQLIRETSFVIYMWSWYLFKANK